VTSESCVLFSCDVRLLPVTCGIQTEGRATLGRWTTLSVTDTSSTRVFREVAEFYVKHNAYILWIPVRIIQDFPLVLLSRNTQVVQDENWVHGGPVR
jgi:hypothetical protein